MSGPHTRHRLVGGNYNTDDDIDIAFVCHVAFLSYWVILILHFNTRTILDSDLTELVLRSSGSKNDISNSLFFYFITSK